jgi:hypothetical protein
MDDSSNIHKDGFNDGFDDDTPLVDPIQLQAEALKATSAVMGAEHPKTLNAEASLKAMRRKELWMKKDKTGPARDDKESKDGVDKTINPDPALSD